MTQIENSTPAAQSKLEKVVNDGMCIGCGICQSVAVSDKLQVRTSRDGYLVPFMTEKFDQSTLEKILDICPGTRVDGLPTELVEHNTKDDLIWGPYQRMVLAWASNPETRFKGSTGGVLTAIAQYLLDSKEVDFILHAQASTSQPTFGEVKLSLKVDQVIQGAGSRYGPTAALINISEILDRNQPFAYIGLPCDISALRNYARYDKRVNNLVRYWLSPVCGGYMPTPSMRTFLKTFAIDFDNVKSFRYRGYGCPGPTRIEMKDGSVIEKTYTDFWGEDESAWSLPHRCKVCPDGIGEATDLAAADTWAGGSPDPKTEEQDPGTNALVIRTTRGLTLVDNAVKAGYLTLGEEVDPRYMDNVQPHQRKKKLNLQARLKGQAAAGNTVPQMNRLRVEKLYEANGEQENQRQQQGTYQRALRLKESKS